MKNLSNKMLYVNAASEEIVVPLSRFLTATVAADTTVKLYFDSHVEGIYGSATMEVDVTCTDAEDVLKSILGAFASSRDSVLDLLTIHSKITAVDVNQAAAGGGIGAKTMTAGTGITTGSGTVYKANVTRDGHLIKTTIYIDIDGLNSSAAGDVIGVDGGTANCHIGQITAAVNGTIVRGEMRLAEAITGGEPDVDLYSATEATLAEDTAISSGTETALLDANADWTLALGPKSLSAFPAADQYLYLVCSGGGTDDTYATGAFIIELWGLPA